MAPPVPRWLSAVLVSTALVGGVTAVIALLEPRVPALGLGALYLLAVVPVALVCGAVAASAVSVVSMAAGRLAAHSPAKREERDGASAHRG